MIFIFVFVCVILKVGNPEPLPILQKPIVVIKYFNWLEIIKPEGLYNLYPRNIIDNKYKICKALNDAVVFDGTETRLYSSGYITRGYEIQAQSRTEDTVQTNKIEGINILVDLLPCKYKYKNVDVDTGLSGWIYLAGAREFDGFILLIQFPPGYGLHPVPHFIGFLTEIYQFEMIMEAKEELRKAFKNFSSTSNELLFDVVHQTGRFNWIIKNEILCASVHQMISEEIHRSYAIITDWKVKYEKITLSPFMDKEASFFQFFKKPTNHIVSALTCEFYWCTYNIFPHPKEFFHSFVIYKCKDFPRNIVYFKEKK